MDDDEIIPGETREPLPHNTGNEASGGVWRVKSPGSKKGSILKIARPPRGELPTGSAWRTSNTPTHFNYWRREVMAYDTEFVDFAYGDAGIRAPELEFLNIRDDGDVELWLEDVSGPSGFEFSIPRFERFAHELGVAQARWVGRVPPATEVPWLSRGWLRQYLSSGPGANVHIRDEDWDAPVAQVWPTEVRTRLRGLWDWRLTALEQVESLPRTLCHLDCWPANLIEDGYGTSVLLDWAFVGDGAIGEDPANLIIDSVTDGLMDAALLPEIAEAVITGYTKGLADGGHRGSADEVRRAVAICAAVKYSWLCPHVISTAVRGRAHEPSYNQDSPEDTLGRVSGLAELLADWAGVLG